MIGPNQKPRDTPKCGVCGMSSPLSARGVWGMGEKRDGSTSKVIEQSIRTPKKSPQGRYCFYTAVS